MTIAVISMIRDAWGGSEELWYDMAKKALAKGIKVVHLAFETPTKHSKMEELEQLGLIRLTRPSTTHTHGHLKKLMHLSVNYVRKKLQNPFDNLLAFNPDIILYNGTCYSIADEKILLRKIEAKKNNSCAFFVLGHLNNDWIRTIDNKQAERIKTAYALCKKVFFVSQRNLDTAKRHLCAPLKNAELVRNPVNLASVEYLPLPEVKETIQLATVGNLVTQHKGQDLLLSALKHWSQKAWILNIYGDGPDMDYLKSLAQFYELDEKVRFHGRVREVKEIWKLNHVLVQPSLMEGMPLAVVEAMLYGRICIATDVGGCAEWITTGRNGFIASAPSVKELIRTLDAAWEQKSAWKQIGLEAHKTAMALYDADAGGTLLKRIIAA